MIIYCDQDIHARQGRLSRAGVPAAQWRAVRVAEAHARVAVAGKRHPAQVTPGRLPGIAVRNGRRVVEARPDRTAQVCTGRKSRPPTGPGPRSRRTAAGVRRHVSRITETVGAWHQYPPRSVGSVAEAAAEWHLARAGQGRWPYVARRVSRIAEAWIRHPAQLGHGRSRGIAVRRGIRRAPEAGRICETGRIWHPAQAGRGRLGQAEVPGRRRHVSWVAETYSCRHRRLPALGTKKSVSVTASAARRTECHSGS
jgi:hypothetical protein